MAGVSWNLEAIAGAGAGAKWIFAGIGVAMTVIMQSSSAAAAATLVALYTGSLTFEQGCAMLVGQSVGSAATTALVVIGGSLAVRRTALAHILFTVIVGVLAMLFLAPLTAAAGWVGARLDDPDGVLALAAFSSIFKLAGIVVFYPVARFLRATSSFASPARVAIRRSAVSTRPLSRRAERSRSRLPGGRSWSSRVTPSKRSAPGSPARPPGMTRRSKRSSTSKIFSNRFRSRPSTWAR